MIVKMMNENDGQVFDVLVIVEGKTTLDEVKDYIGDTKILSGGEHTEETEEERTKRIEYYFSRHSTIVVDACGIRILSYFKSAQGTIFYTDNNSPLPVIFRLIRSNLKKDKSYLALAETNAMNGTCIRRKYGAIIVKDDETIAMGYVGAPRGRTNCNKINKCRRQELGIPSGERYELCESVHAEMNAIISASRRDMKGGTMYLVGIENDGSINPNTYPCLLCQKMLIQSGLEWLIYTTTEDRTPKYVNIKKEFVEKYNKEHDDENK